MICVFVSLGKKSEKMSRILEIPGKVREFLEMESGNPDIVHRCTSYCIYTIHECMLATLMKHLIQIEMCFDFDILFQ